MDPTILDEVSWRIDLPRLMEQLGIKEGDGYAEKAEGMASQAEAVGRPKAVYRASLIESRGEDSVVIEGRTFKSRVLAVNLENVHRVFPFVATCGVELDEWSRTFTSVLDKFWADAIKGMALGASISALLEHIREQHHPGDVSMMSPGSIESWSLSEQRALFSLLGTPKDSIGAELVLLTRDAEGFHRGGTPGELFHEAEHVRVRDVVPHGTPLRELHALPHGKLPGQKGPL